MKSKTPSRLRPVLLVAYGLLLVVFSYLCRRFVAEIFQVPSNSMKSTLLPGDMVLIAKWRPVALHDIAVFQDPAGLSKVLIKRCVGVPGQNLRLVSDTLIVDGIAQKECPNLRYYFDIIANHAELEIFFKNKKLQENEDYEMASIGPYSYRINCDEAIARQLKDLKAVRYLGRSKITNTLPVGSFYYEMGDRIWSTDHMGAIFLPKKGQIIQINDTTYRRYKGIINAFENVKICKADHVFLINRQPSVTYTFKNNYYFFMGDNRQASEDSRMFGPVPESLIIGKAIVILCNTARTDRFLQSICNH